MLRYFKLLLPALICIATVSGCNGLESEEKGPSTNPYIPLTKSQRETLSNVNTCSFDIFRELYAQDKGNLFFSPFSLQTSLTMMLPGATDDTYVQLTKLLGQENRPLEEVLELYKTLIDNLYEVDPSTEFRSANGMFTDKEIVLKDTFVKTASDCFSAGLETVDFSKASAAKETINRWASANTGKKISKLVDDIAYNTKIILVNALYFNGKWANPFDQSKTAKGDFHAIDGSTSKVNFMNQTLTCGAFSTEDCIVVTLPYGNGAFEMNLILPDEGVEFNSFVSSLSYEKLTTDVIYGQCEVSLSLPKFSEESSCDLITILGKMGLTDKTHWAKMADRSDLLLSRIVQKARIDVTEKGTEAAAATEAEFLSYGMLKDRFAFTLDRPFLYTITERSTGTVLFMGAKVK